MSEAKKQRLLDVWVMELNTVYREVPFVVVTDWLQQGRLLGDDCVRLAGSKKWHHVSAVPAFAPYVPKVEPHRAEDKAEALEPVELGFDWGHTTREEEDEDVDMIPLIDISLVLLIFFMMTASVGSGVLSNIDTPSARHQLATIAKGSYWVGIDTRSRAGTTEKDEQGRPLPWYSLGREQTELVAPTRELPEVTGALGKELQPLQGEVKVRLRGDRTLPIETIKGVTLALQDLEGNLNRGRDAGNRLTFSILGEVSEPQSK
jgi:biopolymer transport protein ExbD